MANKKGKKKEQIDVQVKTLFQMMYESLVSAGEYEGEHEGIETVRFNDESGRFILAHKVSDDGKKVITTSMVFNDEGTVLKRVQVYQAEIKVSVESEKRII